MIHFSTAERKIFLKYLLGTLAIFVVAGSIQLGVLVESFSPILVIMPIILSLVIGSILGMNAVLRLRLAESSKVKSEFISRMSHELRTPMTSIIGFSQYMRHQDDLADKYREQADKIHSAGEYLMSMINDLLDLTRLETNQIKIDISPVSLPEVVEECVEIILPIADKSGISIENRIDPAQIPQLLADRVRIRQVVVNMLSNAIKYNRRGGRAVLDADVRDTTIRLRVEDTGVGISEAFMETIFDYFTRSPEHADTVGGTGIGLAVCKSLVELMHGQIGVESVPGEGTTFWVELPRADSEAKSASPQS